MLRSDGVRRALRLAIMRKHAQVLPSWAVADEGLRAVYRTAAALAGLRRQHAAFDAAI